MFNLGGILFLGRSPSTCKNLYHSLICFSVRIIPINSKAALLADPQNAMSPALYQLSPTSIDGAHRDQLMREIVQKRRALRSSGKICKSSISSSIRESRPQTSKNPSQQLISPASSGMIIR